jgi:hypothetical protein
VSIFAVAGSSVPLTADLGPANSGLAATPGAIGFTVYAPNGSTVLARQSNPTSVPGIVELAPTSGIYATQRTFTTPFIGSVVWDRAATTVFAVDDLSVVALTVVPGVVLGGVPVAVTVLDAVTLLAISGVSVQVYLQSDTTFANPLALAFTDTLGQATVFVPPATPLTIRYFKVGYNAIGVNFTSQTSSQPPTTRVDSLTSAFASLSPGMVIVFDRIVDDRGQPIKDVPVLVKINTRPVFVTATSDLLTPDFFETKTDASGFWQIPLVPSSGLTPTNTYYEFEMGKLEPRVRKAAFVADSPPTQRFKDLAPAP